jgi:hypothetical protein
VCRSTPLITSELAAAMPNLLTTPPISYLSLVNHGE